MRLKPGEKDAKAKLDECDKAIRKKAFEDVRGAGAWRCHAVGGGRRARGCV